MSKARGFGVRRIGFAVLGFRTLGLDRGSGQGRKCFGAHTRTIQARHVVRSLMSETTLWEQTGRHQH